MTIKDKKGKPLFFDGVEKEIAANYPPEVLQAYRNKEKYAILDHSRTGVMRVNNLNRKYGLTPIFRALKNVLMLEAFARADNMNSKAAAKKIIFQKMRKESMGTSFERKAWEDMSYAHDKLARAFGQKTVLYTGIPQVEDISYVESKADMISIDTINSYRDRVMVTLGVSFLNTGSHSVSTANISINQLLLTINKIAEQLENVLHNWYKLILDEQGIGAEYAPDIKIIDSEQTSMEIKKSLVEVLFSKLNCSYRTAYEFLGVDIEDEKSRREVENDEKYEEVFFPRQSQYTSGDGAGRPPASEVTDKVDYDKTYNENR